MKTIEREGRSTSKVIENFMKEFDLTLDDFKFEVLEKGTTSFLNLFGSKKAKIRFTLPDSNESLTDFTRELLKKMGFSFGDLAVTTTGKIHNIEIKQAKEAGHIIGKDARLLNSIQYLLNQLVNTSKQSGLKVRLDVDGYRQRRKDALLNKVASICAKVKNRQKKITMEPMHSANRRAVHQFVEKDPALKTITVGKGEYKRVVILPKDQDLPKKDNRKKRYHKRKQRTTRKQK